MSVAVVVTACARPCVLKKNEEGDDEGKKREHPFLRPTSNII